MKYDNVSSAHKGTVTLNPECQKSFRLWQQGKVKYGQMFTRDSAEMVVKLWIEHIVVFLTKTTIQNRVTQQRACVCVCVCNVTIPKLYENNIFISSRRRNCVRRHCPSSMVVPPPSIYIATLPQDMESLKSPLKILEENNLVAAGGCRLTIRPCTLPLYCSTTWEGRERC